MSNLPIAFQDKENSPELLAYLQQFGEKSYLSAEEINQIRDGINELALNALPDAVLKTGTISITGLAVNIAANAFAWRVNQQEFLTPAAYAVNLTAAANGFYRADIIVGTSAGTYQVIQGNPSATTAIEPNVPPGTIRLAGVVIFGTVVGTPTPTPTTEFVQKSERANVLLTGSGVINQLDLLDEKATIVFKGSITRLNTISYASVPYNGKRITLFNAQATPVTIGHSVSGFGVDFVFPDDQDYILEPNQTIEFSFDITYFPYAHHMLIGAKQSSGAVFKSQAFNYTSGLQEFTPVGGIAQVLALFINGQYWGPDTYTYNTTKVTVVSTIPVSSTSSQVTIIYSEAPAAALPTYTRAEQNELFLKKEDYTEVERFLEYKKADLISANLMIDYVGDKGFTDSGVRLDRDYVLQSISVSFSRFVNAAPLVVPVQIRFHEPNSSTQPTPSSGTLILESECFSAVSNVFNKAFDFNFSDEDWSSYTGKFITVNTGNFALGSSTFEDMLVTIKLVKK